VTRVLLAAALAAVAAVGAQAAPRTAACTTRLATSSAQRIDRALRAKQDVWGNAILRAPSYAAAARYLQPLLFARGPKGSRLTPSGVYYVPFVDPSSGYVALHVADGSALIRRRVGGRALTIDAGPERFGSCLARLSTPQLLDGYLPVLETHYVDSDGTAFDEESFVAQGRSFVHLATTGGASIRLVSKSGTLTESSSAYATWSGGAPVAIDPTTYEQARQGVVDAWNARLARGTTFVVPEQRVLDAERALLIQNLELGARYSVGNAYEEFEWPESVDAAAVLGEFGFADAERETLRLALRHRPALYPNWERGTTLVAVASSYLRTRDDAFLRSATPTLRAYVRALASQRERNPVGLLDRERYASDLPDVVYDLDGQAVVVQGLREIARAWTVHGNSSDARDARALAAQLTTALLRALHASSRRLPDGSLFVPMKLLGREPPYDSVTTSRAGSYWNLVAPYALASGILAPGSRDARAAIAYLLNHGARLLGLVRAGAYSLYGRDGSFPASGTDDVYELDAVRFLADNERWDEVRLGLYGQLAAGMTPGTFVSGEAASVAPLGDDAYRSMYLPPNSASNAAFLETLRLLLVHETAHGLELAFGTPSAWLSVGKQIAVTRAPTTFGPVSYTLDAEPDGVHVQLTLPRDAALRTVKLRVRTPGRVTTLDVSARRGPVAFVVH
jgi:hypothetical protein